MPTRLVQIFVKDTKKKFLGSHGEIPSQARLQVKVSTAQARKSHFQNETTFFKIALKEIPTKEKKLEGK